jgi:hypothetical protein
LDESLHRPHEPLPVLAWLGAARRKAEDRVRQAPPGLMLLIEHVHEIQHLSCRPKAREHVKSFVSLMVALDELANDLGRSGNDSRIERLVAGELLQPAFVDQQHPVEHPVLALQVLRRRHVVGFGALCRAWAGGS